jgi:hypothetical protein
MSDTIFIRSLITTHNYLLLPCLQIVLCGFWLIPPGINVKFVASSVHCKSQYIPTNLLIAIHIHFA